MKLMRSYAKELKLASRSFYFYVELAVAVVVLMVLMMVVKPYPDGHNDEYIWNDMSPEVMEYILQRDIKAGRVIPGEDKELKLKPGSFTLYDRASGQSKTYDFPHQEVITVPTVQKQNDRTGQLKGTVYLMPDRESMLRMANRTGKIGAVIHVDEALNSSYEYITQGFETDRFNSSLYILHTFDIEEVEAQKALQNENSIGTIPRLNTRQAVVPVYVTFACALMGFFIVCAYVFLDKSERVIRALLVTPGTLTTYLLSKIMVLLTVLLVSASLVVLPVMGGQPHYPLFYLFLLSATFAVSALGLLVASFYDSMSKAFGVLYLILLVLMLPVIPYYVGSCDPLWMHFLPTWPVLECFKTILQGQPSLPFVLGCTAGALTAGGLLLVLARHSFRRTLAV